MANVFLSYSPLDRDVAAELADRLSAHGHEVFADLTVVAGESSSTGVEQAIAESDAVVVLLSHHSKRSKWVEEELRSALTKKNLVIPVLLDEDATNNWVWPLVSDRFALQFNSDPTAKELSLKLDSALRAAQATSSATAAPEITALGKRDGPLTWRELASTGGRPAELPREGFSSAEKYSLDVREWEAVRQSRFQRLGSVTGPSDLKAGDVAASKSSSAVMVLVAVLSALVSAVATWWLLT